jgi:uracil-DNA glycosylase
MKYSKSLLKQYLTDASWSKQLQDEFNQEYFSRLETFLSRERNVKTIFPREELVFAALNTTPLSEVKVVILGQDPYHKAGQANGLAFSVPSGIKMPPSLRNIFKEIQYDLGVSSTTSGDLTRIAKQGVLLLNTCLTVEEGKAGAHAKKGWERFTDKTIESLSENRENLVFLLWGNHARGKRNLIDTEKHVVFEAPHPSPLSAYSGFFGCKHFSKTNTYLTQIGEDEIDWALS